MTLFFDSLFSLIRLFVVCTFRQAPDFTPRNMRNSVLIYLNVLFLFFPFFLRIVCVLFLAISSIRCFFLYSLYLGNGANEWVRCVSYIYDFCAVYDASVTSHMNRTVKWNSNTIIHNLRSCFTFHNLIFHAMFSAAHVMNPEAKKLLLVAILLAVECEFYKIFTKVQHFRSFAAWQKNSGGVNLIILILENKLILTFY